MANDLPALYRLGIVGAGQIARMTHQAAVKLGITPRLLAESYDDSAALAAPDTMFGHPDALPLFAESCEVVTFEHERLDIGLVERLEADGAVIRPGSKTLRAAFDKIHQRRLLLNRDFPIPVFAELASPDDLIDFTAVFDWPVVIKSVRVGKPTERSVWIVETQDEALRVMAEQAGRQLMVENYQPIVTELVVLVVRRPAGHCSQLPRDRDRTRSTASSGRCGPRPTSVTRSRCRPASCATRLADELDAVGVLAVEFFLTNDGPRHQRGRSPTAQCRASHDRSVPHFTIREPRACGARPPARTRVDAHVPAAVTVNVIGGLDDVDPADHLAEALAVEGAQSISTESNRCPDASSAM